jgi:hypothetical protein
MRDHLRNCAIAYPSSVDEWNATLLGRTAPARPSLKAAARAPVEPQQALSKLSAERAAQDPGIGSLETTATAMRDLIARLS